MAGEWVTVVHGAGDAIYVNGKRIRRYQERVLALETVLFWPGDGDVVYVDGEPQRLFTWDEMAALADVT